MLHGRQGSLHAPAYARPSSAPHRSGGHPSAPDAVTRSDAGATAEPGASLTPREASGPTSGFLPSLAPTDALPPALMPHVEACRSLAARYHHDGADVRPWLAQAFATWDPRGIEALAQASDIARDGAMSAVSMLAHAYRWGAMPAAPDAHALAAIELPAGLSAPLGWLAQRLGVPACGNLYHMLIANWRLPGCAPGSACAPATLRDGIERVTTMHSWLQGPMEEHLTATLRCLLLTEVAGAEMLPAVLRLGDAALRGDAGEAVALLHTLRAGVAEVSGVLGRYMRPQRIAPEAFLSVIQPHFGWGMAQDGVRLDGASGAQTATIQLLDAAFGVRRESAVGVMAMHARAYLPAAQRALLEAVDRRAPAVRSFVAETAGPEARELWNDCLASLHQWRRAHQKRGAMYLRTESASYHSVSGIVAKQDGPARAHAFERAMEEHVQETIEARLAVDVGAPTEDPRSRAAPSW
ncbi:MAG: hypothetical protein Q8S73_15670 [Deltaproteobacteria bacterium]|nr:hypothetical protein [Myxococcales bacterium]MDP3215545.1 hypothetical protein [Deltaproteobacteria bacterium]